MKTYRLTDPFAASSQYPDIVNWQGDYFVSYQCYENGTDVVKAGKLNGEIVDALTVSKTGKAYQPKLFVLDSLYLVWSESDDSVWRLCLSVWNGEGWSEPVEMAKDIGVFQPYMTSYEGETCLFYTQQSPGVSKLMLRKWNGESWSEGVSLSEEIPLAYRAKAVLGGDGRFYLACDGEKDGRYQIYVGVLEGTSCHFSAVDFGTGYVILQDIMPTKRGVSLVWTETRRHSQVSYLSAESFVEDGKLEISKPQIVTNGDFWCLSASMRETIMGYSFGSVIQFRKYKDGVWGDTFQMMDNDYASYNRRPRFWVDESGDIYVVWQQSSGVGHTWIRNAHICFACITEEDYLKKEYPADNFAGEFPEKQEAEKRPLVVDAEEKRAWREDRLSSYEGYEDYWGDIHGQSTLSDGIGEVDQYFHALIHLAGLDFGALSDHDVFPDVISPSEWQVMRTYANHLSCTDRFAAMLGYEWTSNEFRYDYGHKNVYFRGDDGEYIRCVDKKGYSPERLYESFRGTDTLIIPHHVGAVWPAGLASTDWEYHDSELQRVCEILSCHAVFEHDNDVCVHTNNVPREERNSLNEALRRGYRMGFTGGSDSHQMEAGCEGGITCVLTRELTREAVFDAMRDRRCYASTGARIQLEFAVNGNPMGSEITVSKGETVEISLRVLACDGLKSVRVIKNGEVFCEAPVTGRTASLYLNDTAEEDAYYYLRAEQEDGHLAIASPVWVDHK